MRQEGERDARAPASAERNDGRAARMDWRRSGRAVDLATFLLLLWPLVVNGAPFYSEDSASYLRGGGLGFDTALLLLSHAWQAWFGDLAAAGPVAESPQAIAQAAVADAGGVRSLIYSLLAYLLRFPGSSLVGLVVAQAAAVTVIVSCLRRLILPGLGVWPGVAIGAAVALLTSAAWYAAYAMPDILAGTTIGGSMILTVFLDRLRWPTRVLLVLLVALGITVHGSHLPVALATLGAGAVAWFWLRRGSSGEKAAALGWFAAPLLLAVLALFASSFAAFGEASLSPKRYPILLARSVADGPGAWYLHDHCATERYAICDVFGPNPPRDVGDFLWATDGVRALATPEQMERIRAEEAIIIRRATAKYPLQQLGASATNVAAQFFQFGLTGLPFGQRLIGIEDPVIEQAFPDRPTLRTAFEIVIYASFLAGIGLLGAVRRSLGNSDWAAIGVALIGLLANAAVCGILSGVTDRYQGRAAWVLVTLLILIGLRAGLARRGAGARWRPRQT